MVDRLMPDTPRFQVTHIGAWGRGSDDLHAGVGEGAQLRTEKESQTHVGRGQVHQPAAGKASVARWRITGSSPLPGAGTSSS